MKKVCIRGLVQLFIVLFLLAPFQVSNSINCIKADAGSLKIQSIAEMARFPLSGDDWGYSINVEPGCYLIANNNRYLGYYEVESPINYYSFSVYLIADDFPGESQRTSAFTDKYYAPQYDPYRSSDEFFLGITLPLFKLQPSPMIKVKLGNSPYRKEHKFDKGWHHLYTGLICYALGSKTKNKWVKTIGKVIIADDLVQHTFRVQSPLHMMNDGLWKHSWYQQTTTFMDKIMGKSRK